MAAQSVPARVPPAQSRSGRSRSAQSRSGPAQLWTGLWRAGADLVLPITCGGCARPGDRWCTRCARRLADSPVRCRPRVEVGADVWALGPYRGPHRRAVIELKEHGRRDLAVPLGVALAAGVGHLARWGELPDRPRLWLVPAPTRPLAARRRGGDPVTAIADVAARRLGPRVGVAPMLLTRSGTRDSAGLDARTRSANLTGAIRVRRLSAERRPDRGEAVVLVDDVLTTGATAAGSARALTAAGLEVAAVLVIAAA